MLSLCCLFTVINNEVLFKYRELVPHAGETPALLPLHAVNYHFAVTGSIFLPQLNILYTFKSKLIKIQQIKIYLKISKLLCHT